MDISIIIPIAGVAAILFAAYLANDVLRSDRGTPEMQNVASKILAGANAFLRTQYTTIAILAAVAAVIIAVVVALVATPTDLHGGSTFDLGWKTALAFLLGAAASGLSGFIGMAIAVRSNLRTAAAAQRSLKDALRMSLSGGAVSGFLVVALSLLGVYIIYSLYGGASASQADNINAPFLIVGFGFGASFVALFAQLGGGIYTKAADVGADLVGKVEAGIPEDDPRNPAVIADLVGDNVGDCAGRGADLFESTAAENIGAMILGVSMYTIINTAVNVTHTIPANSTVAQIGIGWLLFPLVVRAFGIFASIVGLMAVRILPVAKDPMNSLNNGYYIMSVISAAAVILTSLGMLHTIWFGLAGIVGIVTSIAFVFITQYYTAGSWRPVRDIADASRTGPATNIIAGVAVGFETTALSAIAICIALGSAYWMGTQALADLGLAVNPQNNSFAGVFGTAAATMGMLMSCAYILAMDTFGPITDNAGGITEMSHAPEHVRKITDGLDAVGNTTKALTKGYAVGSASLAAFLLFSAFLEKVSNSSTDPAIHGKLLSVNMADVKVFIGAFLGAMLVYLFSSLAIKAVGRAATGMIEEVRRQFKADPGIMAGTSDPDYGKCVEISTRAALREMIAPGLLAIGSPVLVGYFLRWEAAAAFLMVGTISGVLLATVLNNGGGAWDNAKKYIESGEMRSANGQVIKKGSYEHAAAVVGDTVGDPFKDTAGPSLHVLIKLLSTITLLLATLFI
jgi:K(+)-stimulated pyrophosphate-energized sodium pump